VWIIAVCAHGQLRLTAGSSEISNTTNSWAALGALATTNDGATPADRGAAMSTNTVPSTAVYGDVFWFSLDTNTVQRWIDTPTSNDGVVVWSTNIAGTYWQVLPDNAAGGGLPAAEADSSPGHAQSRHVGGDSVTRDAKQLIHSQISA